MGLDGQEINPDAWGEEDSPFISTSPFPDHNPKPAAVITVKKQRLERIKKSVKNVFVQHFNPENNNSDFVEGEKPSRIEKPLGKKVDSMQWFQQELHTGSADSLSEYREKKKVCLIENMLYEPTLHEVRKNSGKQGTANLDLLVATSDAPLKAKPKQPPATFRPRPKKTCTLKRHAKTAPEKKLIAFVEQNSFSYHAAEPKKSSKQETKAFEENAAKSSQSLAPSFVKSIRMLPRTISKPGKSKAKPATSRSLSKTPSRWPTAVASPSRGKTPALVKAPVSLPKLPTSLPAHRIKPVICKSDRWHLESRKITDKHAAIEQALERHFPTFQKTASREKEVISEATAEIKEIKLPKVSGWACHRNQLPLRSFILEKPTPKILDSGEKYFFRPGKVLRLSIPGVLFNHSLFAGRKTLMRPIEVGQGVEIML